MNSPDSHQESAVLQRANRLLAVSIALFVLMGFFRADSTVQFFAYLITLSAAFLPTVLWMRMGAPGIPILPAVAGAYVPYFALPVLRGHESMVSYTPWEILRASLTVALFLITATVVWRFIASKADSRPARPPDHLQQGRLVGLLSAGLLVGVVFYVSLISEWLIGFGSLFGLIRSVAVTFATVACFLMGIAKAQGLLRGTTWYLAVAGLILITLLAWSSLFLVGGMVYLLACIFGYVIVARRVPWVALGIVLGVVAILHAGKEEMRTKYWLPDTNYGGVTSVIEVPELLAEWVGDGLNAISADAPRENALERASLLRMILKAQHESPDRVPFLYGETYAFLPSILMPRFINADKPASQAAMNLLNLHYGLLTVEGVAVTAVGWGLVAEAYANFGYFGVIFIALLLGASCGGLAAWSAGAEVMSLRSLLTMAALMVLINLESDFIQVFTTLLQSFVAVLVFALAYRFFVVQKSNGQSDTFGPHVSATGRRIT